MTKDELHAAAMALPGTELSIKWGDDHCYCVGGKMFCATDGAYTGLGWKATEIAFEALTSSGRAMPSKYLARAHWLNIDDLASQDAAEVADWIKTAHALVSAKLPKKLKAELGIA